MHDTQLCPCGSQQELTKCCLPYIQKAKSAPTAEALLRARYTAFTRGDVDFILDTHHSQTRAEVNRDKIQSWSQNSDWVGLKLLETKDGTPSDSTGTIAFHVQYRNREDGKLTDHLELSEFEKEDGEWRFRNAKELKQNPIRRTDPKLGRNDPCACGSGKKFKKCCAT
jgi:SEC-C motif domain protein